MNQFKLMFDQDKKIWFVSLKDFNEHSHRVSVRYLVNPNNREKWLQKSYTLHIEMQQWLKNEHPEFFI